MNTNNKLRVVQDSDKDAVLAFLNKERVGKMSRSKEKLL